MVMIIVGNPDSSNEIYIPIDRDKQEADDYILAINGHQHINKRNANSASSSSSKKIRLSKDQLDLKVYFLIIF